MNALSRPRHLWFKASLGLGVLISLVLLLQTVFTYRYVSRNLIRQEARDEAERRLLSIRRAARLTQARTSKSLEPVLHELVHESPQTIDWIRIVDVDGQIVAESESVQGAPPLTRARLEQAARGGRGRGGPPGAGPTGPAVFEHGDVLIVLAPLGPPGGRGQRNAPAEFAEIAIFLNGISVHFGPLRQNLVVGTTAAFALLGAVVLIGFRFPNYMRAKHVEEELELARRVQLDLFPPSEVVSKSVDFSACCIPALEVGGDLYDVFETDTGEIALVLGDVSGKGLPAALLMGVVQGAVRGSTHPESAERLNQLLCLKTARERFVSLFWGTFDPRTRILRYVNAGHLPPLLVRNGANGPVFRCLDDGGPVLGLLPKASYTPVEVAIEDGDFLVVYSDGILEAANAADQEFGEEGVRRAIERHWNEPPGAICNAILSDVDKFLSGKLPEDDQTLLVARLAGASARVAQARV